MTTNAGTLVVAEIRPNDSADTYPTHFSDEGKGGYHTASNTTDRDAIPSSRRIEGMACLCTDTNTMFVLIGGITNDKWIAYSSAGYSGYSGRSGYSGISGYSGTVSGLASGQILYGGATGNIAQSSTFTVTNTASVGVLDVNSSKTNLTLVRSYNNNVSGYAAIRGNSDTAQMAFNVYGSSYPYNFFGGYSGVNLIMLYAQNSSNFLIATNNASPIRFIYNSNEVANITDKGLTVPQGYSGYSGENQSNLSVNQMALSQLHGGAYFGRTGIKENQLGLTDIGTDFKFIFVSPNCYVYDIAMSSDGRIQAVVCQTYLNAADYIYVSLDYGATWTQKASLAIWRCIGMSSDGKIITAGITAAGNTGYLWVSNDYGETWNQRATNIGWTSISMSSDGRIQLATSFSTSTVFISYDYGTTWSAFGHSDNWYDSAMSSDGRIQIITNEAYIYNSFDYGATWNRTSALLQTYTNLNMSSDGRIMSASASTGYVYVSLDYGFTWSQKAISSAFYGLSMSSDGRIQASINVNTSNLYVSSDYGSTWNSRGLISGAYSLAMSSDGKVITCSKSNGVYISYATSSLNGKLSVTGDINASSGYGFQINGAAPVGHALIGDGTRYVDSFVGNDAPLSINQMGVTDYGLNWRSPISNVDPNGITMSSNGQVILVAGFDGSSGYVYKSIDFGATFTPTFFIAGPTNVAISGDGRLAVLIWNSDGSLLISSDYGLSWSVPGPHTTTTTASPIYYNSLAVSRDGSVVVYTSGGVAYVSRDTGVTWIAGTGPAYSSGNNMAISADGRIQATVNGGIYISNNYGATWSSLASSPSGSLIAIAMSDNGQYVTVVESSGYIYVSSDYGVTWDQKLTTLPWVCVSMSYDGRIQLASNNEGGGYAGKCYLSTDFGSTWVYLNDPELIGLYESVVMSGDARVMAVGGIYGLLKICNATSVIKGSLKFPAQFTDENQSNFSVNQMALSQLHGGAYFGRVGLTENQLGLTDIGTIWINRGSNLNYNDIAMSSNGQYQTVVGNSDYIYVSYDYGATWTQKGISTAYQSVAMSSDGKIQTAVAGAGYIYISSDYGVTWTQKSDSASYFSIAMSSDGRIQVVCESSYLYISYNFGKNWTTTQVDYGSLDKIAVSSDGWIMTGHNSSYVYTSFDGGKTWASSIASITGMRNISMSSDGRIQVINSNGVGVYVSYDYGVTWTLKLSIVETLLGTAISSNGQIQASISQQYVHLSSDYGATWGTVLTCSYAGKSIAMSSDGKIITCVENGSYIHVCYATSVINGVLQLNSNIKYKSIYEDTTVGNTTISIDVTRYCGFSWRPPAGSGTGTYTVTLVNGSQGIEFRVLNYDMCDWSLIVAGFTFKTCGYHAGILFYDNGAWRLISVAS